MITYILVGLSYLNNWLKQHFIEMDFSRLLLKNLFQIYSVFRIKRLTNKISQQKKSRLRLFLLADFSVMQGV
jgi:hypothetical protein